MATNPAQEEYDLLFGTSSINDKKPRTVDSSVNGSQSDRASDDGSTTLHSPDTISHSNTRTPSPMASATYFPSSTQIDANTGPKGVIADARSFEDARKRSFRQTLYSFAESAPFKRLNATPREKSKSPSPDPTVDEDDDEFMRQWRQNRIEELSSTKQEVRTRRSSPSKRRYGTVVTVDPAGYLDAVEKVSAETIVVVLIYDEQVRRYLPDEILRLVQLSMSMSCHVPKSFGSFLTVKQSDQCCKVEDALRQLAKQNITTRFVRLHYQDAEMDEIAVPGVLAYRGGECFANLVSFMSELPNKDSITTSSVRAVLQRYVVMVGHRCSLPLLTGPIRSKIV